MFPNQKALVFSILVVLLAVALGYVLGVRAGGGEKVYLPPLPPSEEEIPREGEPLGEEPIACTMEAKMCPDGSYVGRTGPRCEFAPCPEVQVPEVTEAEITMRLGEKASALGVTITAHEVLADSRCPTDVVCIQMGTIHVHTTVESGLGTSSYVFKLNEPMTTEAEEVTLVRVTPLPTSSSTIAPQQYEFTFLIKKR